MNGCARIEGFDPAGVTLTVNRWVRGETWRAVQAVTAALETCAFDEAATGLYRFIWNVFCDWFVEFAKPILLGEDEAAKAETRATAAWVLETTLRVLHPVSPFLTEELWAQTADRDGLLISAAWPELPAAYVDAAADAEIGLVIAAVTEGRSVRAALNVPPGARPGLSILTADKRQRAVLLGNSAVIAYTLRTDPIVEAPSMPAGAVPLVVEGVTLALQVGNLIDLPTERARLTKEIAAHTVDIDRTTRKLANADFVRKAPEDVVEENRARLAAAEGAKGRLEVMVERLGVLG